MTSKDRHGTRKLYCLVIKVFQREVIGKSGLFKVLSRKQVKPEIL